MFIAEDGILFRPSAVLGKNWLLEQSSAISRKPTMLSWQPTFAYVAAAGDMGYTFGPWEYKQHINDQKRQRLAISLPCGKSRQMGVAIRDRSRSFSIRNRLRRRLRGRLDQFAKTTTKAAVFQSLHTGKR